MSASVYLFFVLKGNGLIDRVSIHPVSSEDWLTEDTSITLYGEIHYPNGFNRSARYPGVVLFHGYGRSLNDYLSFISELTQRGILCFAIDFRGFGRSSGTFPSDGKYYNASFGDAMAAIQYLKMHPNSDPGNIVALGTSLGGGASIFLAIMNQTNKFVAWYPAVGYYLGEKSLFEYHLPFSDGHSLIMVGTDDECTRCKPSDVQHFAENNHLEIYWLQGAKHTDSRYYQEVVGRTLEWIERLWNLSTPDLISSIVSNQIFVYSILIGIIFIDFLYLLKMGLNKRKREQKRARYP